MKGWTRRALLLAALGMLWPLTAPAPLIYRAGEGWYYEPVGAKGDWIKARAKDQLEVAKQAFEKKDYSLAMRAARRTVSQWPLSDYAPEAQYLLGRCYEAKGNGEKAFKEYQKLLEKYPKIQNYEEIVKRQYEIANSYLGGKWFRLFGLVPLYPSMEKTADMYEKILKNAPYADFAPEAQMKIGVAQEKKKDLFIKNPDYEAAVKAYEKAADRYHDRPKAAADALFNAGLAYYKQARAAEYDQNISAKAIATFSDFIDLYPTDSRVQEAVKMRAAMQTERARGYFEIARYYERRKFYTAAEIYYNETVNAASTSPYALEALKRIDYLKKSGKTRPVASKPAAAPEGDKAGKPGAESGAKPADKPADKPAGTANN